MNILSRLLPRQVEYFDLFEQHAAITAKAAAAFAVWARGEPLTPIKPFEREADHVVHLCMDALNKTFITPIERLDIHRLITALDDITDHIEAAASKIGLYGVTEPRAEMAAMADALSEGVQRIGEAVAGLRDMRKPDVILEKCDEISRIEERGDRAHADALRRLFADVKDPITIIKWKDIIEDVENALDACDMVSNIVVRVVLESK
jgi:hypothetical protein